MGGVGCYDERRTEGGSIADVDTATAPKFEKPS